MTLPALAPAPAAVPAESAAPIVAAAPRARTVLVGCSFAGLEFLYRLARRRGQRGRFAPGEITVIEPRDQHPFIPLMHEVASGVRPPKALLFDTPAFVRALGAEWVAASASGLDVARRMVLLDGGREVPYDRLIIAVGSIPDIPPQFTAAPGLSSAKFITEATALRRRLHVLRVSGSYLLRVVVLGAGITGVEWSAELGGGRVDGARLAVTLIGAETRVLPRFRLGVARRAARALSRLGVEVLVGHRVKEITRDHLVLDDGTVVPFDVIVWAGGVRPNPLVSALGLPVTSHGHLIVSPRLTVPGHDGIFAMGDCARIVDPESGREWPTMERAIEAIWQGAYLARRLAADLPATAGPPHRLCRDFFYGLSLGPRRSAIVYKGMCMEGRSLVWFRRWLQWAYYARFRWLAWRGLRGRG